MEGSTLRSRRLRLGLSREELAHRVGVPAESVTAWEEDAEPIRYPAAVEQVLRRFERPPAASEEAREALRV